MSPGKHVLIFIYYHRERHNTKKLTSLPYSKQYILYRMICKVATRKKNTKAEMSSFFRGPPFIPQGIYIIWISLCRISSFYIKIKLVCNDSPLIRLLPRYYVWISDVRFNIFARKFSKWHTEKYLYINIQNHLMGFVNIKIFWKHIETKIINCNTMLHTSKQIEIISASFTGGLLKQHLQEFFYGINKELKSFPTND